MMTGILLSKPEELRRVQEFPHWNNPSFLMAFFLACIMGSTLNFSTFLWVILTSYTCRFHRQPLPCPPPPSGSLMVAFTFLPMVYRCTAMNSALTTTVVG